MNSCGLRPNRSMVAALLKLGAMGTIPWGVDAKLGFNTGFKNRHLKTIARLHEQFASPLGPLVKGAFALVVA